MRSWKHWRNPNRRLLSFSLARPTRAARVGVRTALLVCDQYLLHGTLIVDHNSKVTSHINVFPFFQYYFNCYSWSSHQETNRTQWRTSKRHKYCICSSWQKRRVSFKFVCLYNIINLPMSNTKQYPLLCTLKKENHFNYFL